MPTPAPAPSQGLEVRNGGQQGRTGKVKLGGHYILFLPGPQQEMGMSGLRTSLRAVSGSSEV